MLYICRSFPYSETAVYSCLNHCKLITSQFELSDPENTGPLKHGAVETVKL